MTLSWQRELDSTNVLSPLAWSCTNHDMCVFISLSDHHVLRGFFVRKKWMKPGFCSWSKATWQMFSLLGFTCNGVIPGRLSHFPREPTEIWSCRRSASCQCWLQLSTVAETQQNEEQQRTEKRAQMGPYGYDDHVWHTGKNSSEYAEDR